MISLHTAHQRRSTQSSFGAVGGTMAVPPSPASIVHFPTLSGGLPQTRSTHVSPCSSVSAANCKRTRPLRTHEVITCTMCWIQTKWWDNKQHVGTPFATPLLCLSQATVSLSRARAKDVYDQKMMEVQSWHALIADCPCTDCAKLKASALYRCHAALHSNAGCWTVCFE